MERLIERVWPQAYRLAWGILRDRGLAEDAAQEACAAIAASLSGLHDAGAFASWSYRVIVNRALAAARRRQPVEPLDDLSERPALSEPSDALALHDALASLAPSQRAAVLLHYYAGLSSREIASVLKVSASTVRFRLLLARRALRCALSPYDARELTPQKEMLTDVR